MEHAEAPLQRRPAEEETMKTCEQTTVEANETNAAAEKESLPLVVKTLRSTMRTSLSAGTFHATWFKPKKPV
jgi:hypothetical protein